MPAEDFVLSLDYWFPQRDVTRNQLLTVVPALHDLELAPDGQGAARRAS